MSTLKKIFITGINGFVGVQLAKELTMKGYAVAGSVRSEKFNSNSLPSNVSVTATGDVNTFSGWEDLLSGFDAVIHLAARAHVLSETVANPAEEFFRVNTQGAMRLGTAAAKARVRRFVFLSTIGVNGVATHDKAYSEVDLPHPHDLYSKSKWAAEQELREIARDKNLELVIIRPPLVYGPNVKGNFLRLLKIISRGYPLPLATTQNRRSFVGVVNLCDFIRRCLEDEAAVGRTFIVSDGEALSTTDLIRRMAKFMGRKPNLFSINPSIARIIARGVGREDLWQRLFGSLEVDSGTAKSAMSWIPPKTIDDGIRDMVEWYTGSNEGTALR